MKWKYDLISMKIQLFQILIALPNIAFVHLQQATNQK